MAFWGTSFVFNGIPCEEYDLMIYDIGNHTQSKGKFASGVTIVEESIPSRWRPFFYGAKLENKLTFSIVFGVNETRVEKNQYLDRRELEVIASWLTGHDSYMWLQIMQDDMADFRYRCVITELNIIEYGWIPWALEAKVECDSPYAYTYPEKQTIEVSGTSNVMYYNRSTHNGYYCPKLTIETNGGDLFIENLTDGNRLLAFSGLSEGMRTIYIDNDHQVITDSNGENLYQYFNMNFFRAKRGENLLRITGNATVTIDSVFPVNIGG